MHNEKSVVRMYKFLKHFNKISEMLGKKGGSIPEYPPEKSTCHWEIFQSGNDPAIKHLALNWPVL